MDKIIYVLLAVTSISGLGVIIWRAWVLRWGSVVPMPLAAAVGQCRTVADCKKVQQMAAPADSPLARLLQVVDAHADWPKADTEAAVETAARQEIVRLEQGLVVLEIIVGIAPLLGLVGTIFGMMNVFGEIGQTGLTNVNDASKLAQGISLILRTTLIGLLISIPSLIAWSYFSKKVEVLAVEMETLCAEFIRRQYADKK
ncbi:MAG TPA: MotA/TolQ/ExbB proton channel family protein [Verrucomicrobiae bacterium]